MLTRSPVRRKRTMCHRGPFNPGTDRPQRRREGATTVARSQTVRSKDVHHPCRRRGHHRAIPSVIGVQIDANNCINGLKAHSYIIHSLIYLLYLKIDPWSQGYTCPNGLIVSTYLAGRIGSSCSQFQPLTIRSNGVQSGPK